MKTVKSPLRRKTAAALSTPVLYGLTAFALLVFVLYWTIGFDRPYPDNPDFNAPLFTPLIIILGYTFLGIAIAVMCVSVIQSFRTRPPDSRNTNNIPIGRIGNGIAIGVVAVLALMFLIASPVSVVINGKVYDNTFWLKASDTLIYTSVIMIMAATAAVIYGATRYIRRK